MKRSTVNLICAVIWGIGTLAWLPGVSASNSVGWLRIVMPILSAVNCVLQLTQYFRNREAEREAK